MITWKDRKREARKLLKKPPGPLLPIDLCDYDAPEWMSRAFKNNRYVVMINDNAETTAGPAIRAMIQRHDDTPISWKSKQEIKNEIFGAAATAIEYYPAESELIDHHNIYWLWIFPKGTLPKPVKGGK